MVITIQGFAFEDGRVLQKGTFVSQLAARC